MMRWIVSCAVVFFACSSECTQVELKQHKSRIGETLTPTNALFSRHIYEKDEKGVEVERQTTARTMLMFLDDSEYGAKNLGVITQGLLTALLEKPCILLLSRSLLHNIFFNHAQSKNKLIQQVMKQFDSGEWLIKIPLKSDALLIMIPQSYIVEKAAAQGFTATTVEDLTKETDFNLDRLLGLHVSTMRDLEKDTWKSKMQSSSYTREAFAALISTSENSPFVPYKEYLGQTIRKTLEEIADIKQTGHIQTRNELPQWDIYLTGHGSRNYKSICGLQDITFKNFLTFLNAKIVTKIFIYESCQASGINRVTAYDEIGKNVGTTYPFPIIAVGIGEANTYSDTYSNIRISYQQFVQLAESSDVFVRDDPKTIKYTPAVPYSTLLRTLIDGFKLFMKSKMEVFTIDAQSVISSFPFIRFPNRPLFLPLMPMLEITQLFVDGRDAYQPFNVREFIQKNIDPQLALPASEIAKDRSFFIILDAQYIPFEVRFITKETNPFFIISTLTGDTMATSMHVFDQMYFDEGIPRFVNIFEHITYAQDKIFYVKKLTLANGIEYFDVIVHIVKNEDPNVFVTSKDNKKYRVSFPLINFKKAADYLKEYERAINIIKDLERML